MTGPPLPQIFSVGRSGKARPWSAAQIRVAAFEKLRPSPAGRVGNSFILDLEILNEPLKRLIVGVLSLPLAEIRDEVFANLTSGVLPGVGVEALPSTNSRERHQADGEKHLP